MLVDAANLARMRDAEPTAEAWTGPATLAEFLAGIEGRAFRFAEVALRQRDDALDAVQDAMMKMLAYRDRTPSEWQPLFWSILRNRIIDVQRRRLLRKSPSAKPKPPCVWIPRAWTTS